MTYRTARLVVRSRFIVPWCRDYLNRCTSSASPTNSLKTTFDSNCQYPQSVEYKGFRLECGYRIDLLVEDVLILKLQSIDKLTETDDTPLLTCMRLADVQTGLLVNSNVTKLKEPVRRFIL